MSGQQQKHTAGPWSNDHITPADIRVQEDDGMRTIGQFWGENCEANARIAAAAPDLLLALQRIVESAEQETDDITAVATDTIEAAHAVIAKAKGEA